MAKNIQALISDGYVRGGFEQELAEALRDEHLFKLEEQFGHGQASAAAAVFADIIAEAKVALRNDLPHMALGILGKAKL